MNRYGLLAMMVLIVGLIFGCGTGDDGVSPKGGLGVTEDVGIYCSFSCDDIWCSMSGFAECTSHLCVGRPDNQYCTDFCLNDNSCPEGFLCTDVCGFINEPYCVLEAHYEHLVEVQLCDPK